MNLKKTKTEPIPTNIVPITETNLKIFIFSKRKIIILSNLKFKRLNQK